MAATHPATTGTAGRAGVWSAIVTLSDVDVSNRIDGDLVIEFEEGAARIAELTIAPATTSFAIADWVGQTITIDLADNATGTPASVARLFSGVVDTPSLNRSAHTIALRCTDNLQNIIEGMSVAAIDAAIPSGYASPVVFDAAARGWSRSQDRLSTVAASLELSPAGALRLTGWAPKSTADLAFTEAHILDNSISVSLASRSSLVNEVTIDFGYRFPRLKAEGHAVSFSYVSETSIAAYVSAGGWFLQRAAVAAAIKSAGGTILSIGYTALPTSTIGQWTPGPYDAELCMGFAGVVSFDYAQTIEENYTVTVSAPASIAVVGTLKDRLSGALVGAYTPLVAAETSLTLYKNGITGIPPQDTATAVSGQTTAADVTLTADTNRAAANAALESLIAVAKVRIWASHRQNSVSASVACNPDIDVDKTIDVQTSMLHVRGKCRSGRHRLSMHSGTAVTEFALAVCSVAGTGVTHADTAISAPAGSASASSALAATPSVVFNGAESADHVITITFPEVAAAERNARVYALASSYSAAITEDILDISI